MSDTIHGHPIIHRKRVQRTRDGQKGYVVVVDLGAAERSRFVASLWFEGDDEWCQGHYAKTEEIALQKARELCELYGKMIGDDEEATHYTVTKREKP